MRSVVSTATAAQQSTRDEVVVDAGNHRRRAWFLVAFAAWNVFVWGTRVRNLIGSDEVHTTAFIIVHTVLYVAGFGGAVVLAVMGRRMLREASR